MAKRLTMISGKGGSGKTSFSLAFAKVLSKSGLKVLLVDCDMCTHGATFFMKNQIEKHRRENKKVISVDDILGVPEIPKMGFYVSEEQKFSYKTDLSKFVLVEKNFYFLPSDILISNSKNYNQFYYYFETFGKCVYKELDKNFDVIIFDCQAGYSDFTRYIATMSDISLLVTQPDSVSAAANKALCFQLGEELREAQMYQIFNQVTEEEAVSYSNITTSAFFINLPPIIFSLDVRRAFMHLQIPSCDTCDDSDFNRKVLNIMLKIFPEYSEQLDIYKNDLYKIIIWDYEKKIQTIKDDEKKKKRISILGFIEILMIMVALVITVSISIYSSYFSEFFRESRFLILYLLIIFSIFVGIISVILFKKYFAHQSDNPKLRKLEDELHEIYYER